MSDQARYHDARFSSLADWGGTAPAIADLTGSVAHERLLGLDQMGHFGPLGCELVADVIARTGRVGDLLELGSGYGGALRDVVHRLAEQGVPGLGAAVGVDLVPEHCRAGREIGATTAGRPTTLVAADARALPVATGSIDVVFITGSVVHFGAAHAAFREVHRVLRPAGLFVFTDEFRLVGGPDRLGAEFAAAHPEPVFTLVDTATRHDQLRRGGFTTWEDTALDDWGCEVLDARLRALKLFRGSAAGIFSEEAVALITRNLRSVLDEYHAGALSPHLVVARPSPDGGAR